MKRVLPTWLLLWYCLVCAFNARAHEMRPAYLEIEESSPNRFNVLWKQPSIGPLVLRLEPKLSNGLLDANPDEEFVVNGSAIRRWKNRALALESFDGATLTIEGLERTLIDTLVTIEFANGKQVQALLRPDHSQFDIHLSGAGKFPVPVYLPLGIEHILTGFDHLSFVLGLMLLVRNLRNLLMTITAFTIAHSVTLAAAALGYVKVSAPEIESLVALSIVFVALEIVRSMHGHAGLTTRYPWLIASIFGLLHGFAFAGSLAEIGLPSHNIPGALFLFNCGVEIGQLLFVGVTLVSIAVIRRLLRPCLVERGRWLTAYGIGTLACYWVFARVDLLVP